MAYEVRSYAPSDADQVVALHSSVFQRHPELQAAYFEWKYDQNPFLPGRRFLLGCRDGDVVATFASYALDWRFGDAAEQPRITGLSEIAVAPEHRGNGLLEEMSQAYDELAAGEGLTHLVSLSAVPATYIVCRRTGWQDLGALPEVATNVQGSGLDLLRPALCRVTKAYPPLAKPLARLRPKRKVPQGGPELPDESVFAPLETWDGADVVAVDDAPRPDEMARLVADLPRHGQVWQVRDTRYFAWRFRDPLRRYRFLYIGQPLQGFLVVGATVGGTQIVEFEWRSPEAGRALLEAAVKGGEFAQLRAWAPTTPDEPGTLLAEQGFQPVDVETLDGRARKALLAKPIGATAPLPPIEEWELRMASSDAF